MTFDGRCHCGLLTLTFESARPASELPLRECACSFCRRHGATALTDPGGHVEVRVGDPSRVSRYQFGLRTAEFLVCRECGVYVAAVCVVGGKAYASLNANVLDARSSFTSAPSRVDYDGETPDQRLARRVRAWTPAEVVDAPVTT